MINDIGAKIFNKDYKIMKAQPNDYLLVYREGKIWLDNRSNEVAFPKVEEDENPIYLFSIDEKCFFLHKPDTPFSHENGSFETLFRLRSMNPDDLCFAGMTGYHLYKWYRDNQYCGKCGHKTIPGTKERRLDCPNCGNLIFPKIAPAIVVCIIHGDEVLLTRYQGREYKGYAVIGGFMEIGEMAEDTIRREVMEEVGLKVKNLIYYKSLPWGFDSDILISFFAELDGDSTVHVDHQELAEGVWVNRKDIEPNDRPVFLGAEMLELFRLGLDPYSKERQ